MGEAPDDDVDLFEAQANASISVATNATGYLDVGLDQVALKERALVGASATFLSQAVKFGLKFGSAIVLGRLLGPAQFGLVAMVAPLLGFVSTLNDLGLAQAIVQRRDITRGQVSNLFWINLLLSTGLAAALMACAPLIGGLYHEPRITGITLVLACTIVLGTLGLAPSALLDRQMRFMPLVLIDTATLAVSAGASVVFALLGLGVWALVLGQAAGSLVGLVSVWSVAGWWPQRPTRSAHVGPLVRFGVNLTAVNLATYLNMTADNMIVGVFAGKVPLGLYDRSYTLVAQPVAQLMAPVGRVAIPLLSRLTETPDRFRAAYLHMLRVSVILTAPAMICCAIMPRSAILLLLGEKWSAAAPIFGWVCFGGMFSALFGSAGWVFTTQGRSHAQMVLSTVSALIGILSFAVGISWGVVGVARLGALGFCFIQTPLMLWGMTRKGVVGVGDVAQAVLSLCAAGVVAAAAALAVDAHPFPGDLFVAGAVAYASFAGVALALPGGRALRASLWGVFTQSVLMRFRTAMRRSRRFA